MAEHKKSFILYADLIYTVKKMPKDKAGELLMTILEYVNDLNPVVTDLMIDIAFEPIKQQMKRDLVKWEDVKETKSQSGILGNLKRWNLDLYQQVIEKKLTIEGALEIAKHRKGSHTDRTVSHSVANIAVNDSVTVNDTVTVTVNDTVIKKVDDVVIPSSPTAFFTIHNFESEISIGQNEFTLLAIRKTGRPKEELSELLTEFIKDQKGLTKLIWQNAPDAKNHFINWVKKQPKAAQSRFVM